MGETLYHTSIEGYFVRKEWNANLRFFDLVCMNNFKGSWCWHLNGEQRTTTFPNRYHINTIDLVVRVPDDRLVKWITLLHEDYMPEKWSIYHADWEFWKSHRELSWTYWYFQSYRFFYLPNFRRYYNGITNPWMAIEQRGGFLDTPPINYQEVLLHEYLENTDDHSYLKEAYFQNQYYLMDTFKLRTDFK